MQMNVWLPQAGILAKKLLTERLVEHGYYPGQHMPGLWQHKWHLVKFALEVDDFGLKITGDKHGEHLVKALQQHYE
eukprot:8874966-Ditylum_brightwellii.AAC.1